jgi:hypothetical protein
MWSSIVPLVRNVVDGIIVGGKIVLAAVGLWAMEELGKSAVGFRLLLCCATLVHWSMEYPVAILSFFFGKNLALSYQNKEKHRFSKRMWPFGQKTHTHTQVKSPPSDPCAI